MPNAKVTEMYATLFFSALILALAMGDAMARRAESRTGETRAGETRVAAAERPRDCIAIGYASIDSITTEGLARGRDPVGAGYLHVATLRNRLARPLEVKVIFEAPKAGGAAGDATREGEYVLAPRGLLRVRLGVTPVRPTDGDLRATVSVLCTG